MSTERGGSDDLLLDDADSNSDATTGGQRHRRDRSLPRQEKHRKVDGGASDSSLSDEWRPGGSANRSSSDESSRSRLRRKADRKRWERRRIDNEIDLVLSSGDDERPTGMTRQSRLKPTHLAKPNEDSHRSDRYRTGDTVEARFGGRSKWFPGKVTRVYDCPIGGALYDIAYDDGDKEEGVLAGRLRRPGQSPPTLHAGLTVDVKVARKGKGYHPGTIGRVNDDGSLYVKLDDGDTEWSISAQAIVPRYPYSPGKSSSGVEKTISPTSLNREIIGEPRDDPSDNSDVQEHIAETDDNRDPRVSPGELSMTTPSALPLPQDESTTGTRDRQQAAKTSLDFAVTPTAPEASVSTPPVKDNIGRVRQPATGKSPASGRDLHGEQPTTLNTPPDHPEQESEGNNLSWIAELASSVRGSTVNSPISPEAKEDPHAAGLTWIEEVANSARGSATAQSPHGPGTVPSVSTVGGISSHPNPRLSPSTGTQPTSDATVGSAAAVPGTAGAPAPRLLTPNHLEWKPIKDGSAQRPWGAPPPDETEPAGATHQDNPPSLSEGRVVPAFATAPTAIHAKTDAPAQQGAAHTVLLGEPGISPGAMTPCTSDGKGTEGGQTRISGQARKPSVSMSKTPSFEGQGPPADPGTEAIAGNAQGRSGTQSVAEESPTVKEDAGKGIRTPKPNTTPQTDGDAQESQGVIKPEASDVTSDHGTERSALQRTGQKGGEGTRWDCLRSSVQRRFAAEAMHLSEEVRLLKAKLQAAEDKAQAKLAQQERKLGEQMQEKLQRERAKLQEVLQGERAASARRISALKEELKRQGDTNAIASGREKSPWIRTAGETSASNTSTNRKYTSRHSDHNTRHVGSCRPMKARPRTSSATETTKLGVNCGHYPPPPPPVKNRGEGHASGTGRGKPTLGEWSEGVSSLATAVTNAVAGDPALDSLVRAFLAGVGSRDRSIREIAADFEGVEHIDVQPMEAGKPGRDERAGRADWAESPPRKGAYRAKGNAQTTSALPAGHPRETSDDVQILRENCRGGSREGRATVMSDAADADDVFFTGQSGRDPGPAAMSAGRGQEPLRWTLEMERRDVRRRLEDMKSEVDRVVGQLRVRTERAEAAAASAEEKAMLKALSYVRSKRSPPTRP